MFCHLLFNLCRFLSDVYGLNLCFKETRDLNGTEAFHTNDFVANFVLTPCRNSNWYRKSCDYTLSFLSCCYSFFLLSIQFMDHLLCCAIYLKKQTNNFGDVKIECRCFSLMLRDGSELLSMSSALVFAPECQTWIVEYFISIVHVATGGLKTSKVSAAAQENTLLCRSLDGANDYNWLVGPEVQKKNDIVHPLGRWQRKAKTLCQEPRAIISFPSEAQTKNVNIYPV